MEYSKVIFKFTLKFKGVNSWQKFETQCFKGKKSLIPHLTLKYKEFFHN